MTEGSSGAARRHVVLLAEDDDSQVLLTQLAFEEAGLHVDLRIVNDGVECLDYLRKAGSDAEHPRPHLVLLDVHLPRMDGSEVMAAIGQDPQLRSYPVVMLTTSTNSDDVKRLYALRCSSYVVKPLEFKAFVETVRQIGHYWLKVAQLPTA